MIDALTWRWSFPFDYGIQVDSPYSSQLTTTFICHISYASPPTHFGSSQLTHILIFSPTHGMIGSLSLHQPRPYFPSYHPHSYLKLLFDMPFTLININSLPFDIPYFVTAILYYHIDRRGRTSHKILILCPNFITKINHSIPMD